MQGENAGSRKGDGTSKSKFKRGNKKKTMVCYSCGNPGHLKRDCEEPPKPRVCFALHPKVQGEIKGSCEKDLIYKAAQSNDNSEGSLKRDVPVSTSPDNKKQSGDAERDLHSILGSTHSASLCDGSPTVQHHWCFDTGAYVHVSANRDEFVKYNPVPSQ